MVTAQVVALACLGPMLGRLSDIFGRKQFLILGNLLGFIGGVMAATAQRVDVVIGGSVFIGIASAMHQMAWSCLAEIVPHKHRAIALGIFQGSMAPATAFAGAIGKNLSESFLF